MLPGFIKNVQSIGYRWTWIFNLLVLQGAAVFFEGISIAAILPVLEIVETGGEVEPLKESSRYWEYLVSISEKLKIPLSLPFLLGGVFVLVLLRQVFIYVREIYACLLYTSDAADE